MIQRKGWLALCLAIGGLMWARGGEAIVPTAEELNAEAARGYVRVRVSRCTWQRLYQFFTEEGSTIARQITWPMSPAGVKIAEVSSRKGWRMDSVEVGRVAATPRQNEAWIIQALQSVRYVEIYGGSWSVDLEIILRPMTSMVSLSLGAEGQGPNHYSEIEIMDLQKLQFSQLKCLWMGVSDCSSYEEDCRLKGLVLKAMREQLEHLFIGEGWVTSRRHPERAAGVALLREVKIFPRLKNLTYAPLDEESEEGKKVLLDLLESISSLKTVHLFPPVSLRHEETEPTLGPSVEQEWPVPMPAEEIDISEEPGHEDDLPARQDIQE